MRRFLQPGGAHRLRNPGNRIVEHRRQRLRGYVTGTEPGAAGQDDQLRIDSTNPVAKLALDVIHLVADHGAADHLGRKPSERLTDALATLIDSLSAGPLGADRQDAGAKGHGPSLESQRPNPSFPQSGRVHAQASR